MSEDHVLTVSHPIRFRGATARLEPDAAPVLDAVARVLRENPEIKRMKILAHWDDSLAAEAALKLTQAQADAVRVALIQRGVAADRLVATGVGAEKPAAATPSAADRAATRRLELRAD